MNPASRRCGAAADVDPIDDRAQVAVSDRVVAAERLAELRGDRTAIAAHNVCEWLPTGRLLPQTSGQG